MGQRVRAVMSELHGEKIDIIDWSEDPAQFVGNALSPAKALRVEVVDAATRTARVTVPDFQLSLAIGREGQNARLAARLTGWRIDIRPDNEPAAPSDRVTRADRDAAEAGSGPAERRARPRGRLCGGRPDTHLCRLPQTRAGLRFDQVRSGRVR